MPFLRSQWIKGFFQFVKRKKFFIFLVLVFLFLPGDNFYERLRWQTSQPLVREAAIDLEIPPYPVNRTEQEAPFLTAKSVVIVDIPSKATLLAKNPDLRLPPASITKIMTALISLETYQLDEALTVPAITDPLGQNIGLKPGEKMAVKNLLYGLLVASANDAALTLAANYPGGQAEFISLMNQKATDLGLVNTHFNNISGLGSVNHYSTTADLAHLSAYAMKQPVFAQIVNVATINVADIEEKYGHRLESTNELIGKVVGVSGVKTGWTEEAGECLATYLERNGEKIIIVLLGSQDRFGETEKLIDWVFDNFEWQAVIPSIPD